MVHRQLVGQLARHVLHAQPTLPTTQLPRRSTKPQPPVLHAARRRRVGPVFKRVWNTPDNGYAERFKHTIEPFLNVQRTTAIDNFDRIIRPTARQRRRQRHQLHLRPEQPLLREAADRPSQTTVAQEIVTVDLRQTYYTDQTPRSSISSIRPPTAARSARISRRCRSAPGPRRRRPRTRRSAPSSTATTASCGRRRSSTGYNWTTRFQTTVGWSQRFFIEGLPGFDNPNSSTTTSTLDTRLRTVNNRFGGSYSFNYDVLRSTMLQQRINGFYNAQCCGIAFEFQRFNYGSSLAHTGRPPVLPVVHAGRPRQLLAVQRRDGERAPVAPLTPILVTGAAGFAGSHLLDLLARTTTATAGRVAPAVGGTAGDRAVAGGARRPCRLGRRRSARQGVGRQRAGADQAADGLSLRRRRPRRPRVAVDGTDPGDQRPGHASSDRRAAQRRLPRQPRAHPQLGARLRARVRAAHRRPPAAAGQPVRAQQARAGAPRGGECRRPDRPGRASVQPFRAAAGSVLRGVRVRAPHRRHRSRPVAARDRRSATSTRSAT